LEPARVIVREKEKERESGEGERVVCLRKRDQHQKSLFQRKENERGLWSLFGVWTKQGFHLWDCGPSS